MGRPADQLALHPPDGPPEIVGPISELQRRVSRSAARTPDEFMTALRDVLRKSDDFLDLFGGTAWSEIAWKKDVGLPLSANLADAFVFKHVFKEVDGVAKGGGGSEDRSRWKDAAAPNVWDGPHDDEHYRVSFMLHGKPKWMNWVGIGLDPNIEWEPRVKPWLAERKRIVEYPAALQPTIGEFRPNATDMIEWDAFQVLWSPF